MKFIFFIILILSARTALPQGCCTAGTNTFGGFERGVLNKNEFSILGGYYSNSLKTTFSQTNEIADPLSREASVSFFNVELEYGLSDNLSILSIANYSIKERNSTVEIDERTRQDISFSSSGIGDLILLIKYQAVQPNILSTFSLALGGGIKLPTGSNSFKVSGTKLPIDLQPGTGSVDALSWLFASYSFPQMSLGVSASLFYRYAGTSLNGYRFGDEIIYALSSGYGIAEYLSASISFKGRFADKDYFSGRILPSTGGSYLDFLPGINYLEKNYSLRIFYQTPLYRNVYGIQLTTSSIIGTEFQYFFRL